MIRYLEAFRRPGAGGPGLTRTGRVRRGAAWIRHPAPGSAARRGARAFLALLAVVVAAAGFAPAAPAAAPAPVTVAPPTLVRGFANQTLRIPVTIAAPGSLAVDAFGLTFAYPTALLQYVGVERTGTLTASWFVVDGAESTPGVVTIGGFDPTPVTTGGTLLNVVVMVRPGAVGSGAVTLGGFTDDLAGATTTPGTFQALVAPGAAGLLGQYYNNIDFTGARIDRVDPGINFNWGSSPPLPSMGKNDWSVRWTGFVQPDFTETYTFHTITDDGVRLWVADSLIIDHWVDQGPTEWTGTIALVAGSLVPVRMEYYDNQWDATAQLYWSSPNTEKQIVPADHLVAAACRPGSGDVDGDAAVTAADADCAGAIYLAGQALPGACNYGGYACELAAADVGCDGAVTPADALAIARRAAAGLPADSCFAAGSVSTPPSPPGIGVRQTIVGGQLRVTVSATAVEGLDAVGFHLTWPAAAATFDRIDPGWTLQGWTRVQADTIGGGELVVAAWDVAGGGGAGPGELVHAWFDLAGPPDTLAGVDVGAFVDDLAGAVRVGVVTAARDATPAPLALAPAVPNPFNPTTRLGFTLPRAGHARLDVLDVAGRRVATLVDERLGAGTHAARWDGRDDRGARSASGVYFAVLRFGNGAVTRRMVLLK